MLKYNSKLKNTSRKLRQNLTEAEKLLWSKIRKKQIENLQFYRQRPIGNYVVDFYCFNVKLIIEVDGGQHYEVAIEKKDKIRDAYLKRLGFKIIRFSNLDVLRNIDGVIEKIKEEIHPNPPLKKEGELKILCRKIKKPN